TKFREMVHEVCREDFEETGARVEMIPILFHSDLHALSSTKPRMDKVTLPSIPWIRTVDNEVIGDILYYFSTFHGHQILQMIIDKLNEVYTKFISQHPEFNGPVCLVAHSLGGLICYEILYLMHMRQTQQKAGNNWESERYQGLPSLKFKPTRLFTMGSPHGGTLVFRNLHLSEYLMGSVGFHNIFHPYDPFGYRIEPLVSDEYADVPAVPISGVAETSSRQTSFSNPSTNAQRVRHRKSLATSVADLGKTIVGTMVVAPATLSSTMLRVAKTSVVAPINAMTNHCESSHDGSSSPVEEKSKLHELHNRFKARHKRQRSRQRSGSFSKILPAFSKSFFRNRSDSGVDPIANQSQSSGVNELSGRSSSEEEEPLPYTSEVAATLSMMAAVSVSLSRSQSPKADHPRQSDSEDSLKSQLQSYTMAANNNSNSMMESKHTPVVASPNVTGDMQLPAFRQSGAQSTTGMPRIIVEDLPDSNSSKKGRGRRRRSSSSSDEASAERMMMDQLTHIFSLSRPPNREQQMAEAQGLPLSSRLLAPRPGGNSRVHATQTQVQTPVDDQKTENDAVLLANTHHYALKRSRTLPLTMADGRRMAHAITSNVARHQRSPSNTPLRVQPPVAEHGPEKPGALKSCATFSVGQLQQQPRLQDEALSDVPKSHRSTTASIAHSVESNAEPLLPELPYGERMDYIIPFTKRHLQNEYWLGFHSHFSYWTSRDVVHHILHHFISQPPHSKQ
ncbi:hypothetical protein H4R24_005460, partial [Coemansia sp. RSA 988]